jgi:hypothetical protein
MERDGWILMQSVSPEVAAPGGGSPTGAAELEAERSQRRSRPSPG